jgi:hypothetical protein
VSTGEVAEQEMLVNTPAAKKWSAILDEAETADLSMREFARSRGLNPNTLAWWRWRLKRSTPRQSAFLPVLVTPSNPLELRVGGAVIQVDGDTDLALLKSVVRALA